MCCGEKVNESSNGSFAKNVKKPSMFLSSLIVKRRDNRRAVRPNMLLDAVLTNAIKNIKKDKAISKLTNLSNIKKFKNNRCKKVSTKKTDTNIINVKNGEDLDVQKNKDLIKYLSEVDSFFEELKNVKVQRDPSLEISNNCLNIIDVVDLELHNKTNNTELSDDDLIDNFIETGILL